MITAKCLSQGLSHGCHKHWFLQKAKAHCFESVTLNRYLQVFTLLTLDNSLQFICISNTAELDTGRRRQEVINTNIRKLRGRVHLVHIFFDSL